MISAKKISSRLYGLVGIQNPTNPAFALVDAANQEARSGRSVTDNPLCKVEYIYDTQDYKEGSAVDFNNFLAGKQKKSIVNVADKVFNDVDFIDRQVLYKNANNKKNLETLPVGFIGHEIEITGEKNYSFEISRVLLEFSGTGNIELLLWNSAKSEPIESKMILINSTLQEEILNWKIDNTDTFYKGKFYLGYLTTGISVVPFKRNYEASNIKSYITGMCVEEVYVLNHTSNAELFDLNLVENTEVMSGINPDITVYEDFSDLMIQNENLFAHAIELQFCIDLLTEIMASPRFNFNQRSAKDLMSTMVIELEGIDTEDGIKKTGLKRELFGQINHIRKEIKKIRNGYFANGLTLNTQT